MFGAVGSKVFDFLKERGMFGFWACNFQLYRLQHNCFVINKSLLNYINNLGFRGCMAEIFTQQLNV